MNIKKLSLILPIILTSQIAFATPKIGSGLSIGAKYNITENIAAELTMNSGGFHEPLYGVFDVNIMTVDIIRVRYTYKLSESTGLYASTGPVMSFFRGYSKERGDDKPITSIDSSKEGWNFAVGSSYFYDEHLSFDISVNTTYYGQLKDICDNTKEIASNLQTIAIQLGITYSF